MQGNRPSSSRVIGGLMAATLLTTLSACRPLALADENPTKEPSGMKIQQVTHRKIDNCPELTARGTRLIVVPAWAGRIGVLDFGAGNVLWTDPKVDGKVVPPGHNWGPWDGNATDLVNSERKNQWPMLWLHPYPQTKVLPDGVELASKPNADTKLSVTKRYGLAGDGKSMQYDFTIVSAGPASTGWTVWERALVPAVGYVIAPVARGGAYPDGWSVRDNTTSIPAQFAATEGDFMIMRGGTEKGLGLSARLSAGWIAHVRPDGVLLMTFPLHADGQYPHYNGANAVFWLAPLNMELEPLSPEVKPAEGESYTFRQVWHWVTLPAEIEAGDHQAMGVWLGAKAKELAGGARE